MTACVKPESVDRGAAVCDGLRGDIRALEDGLLGHPETPEDVGEPGTSVVIKFFAGCA